MDRPRAALWAISAIFFANAFSAASWIPRIPEIRERLGISDAQLGLTLIGVGTGGVVVSAFSSAIADRFGSRQTTMTTSIVLALLLPLIGLADVAPVLFVVLIGIGLFDGLTDVAMNAQAVTLQESRGDQIMARFHGLWSLGTVAGGITCSIAARNDISVRTQLTVTSIGLIAAAIVIGRNLIRTPSLRARRRAALAESAELGFDAPTTLRSGPLPRRRLALLFVIGTAVALTEAPVLDWGTVLWTDHFDYSEERAALAFVSATVGMVIGRLAGDRIIVRLGYHRSRQGGAVLAAAGVVCAVTAPNGLPLSALGLAIAGFGASILFPLMFVAAAKAVDGRTVGMASFSTGARAGFLIGPPIIGGLATLTDIAVALPIVCTLAAVVVVVLRPDRA